jgi:hypothetical protein
VPFFFTRMSFFFLGGSLIASLVSADPTPVLVTIVALCILGKVFTDHSGPGGTGGVPSASKRPKRGHCGRRPRKHCSLIPDDVLPDATMFWVFMD